MNYAIFFAGSGQEINDTKLVYRDWAAKLASCGYATLLCDGVGEFAGTSAMTGSGWAKIIQHAMTWLEGKATSGGNPEKVVVVGMSRGGVQAVICANCLKTRFPQTQVFVFAIDPVQGFHAVNEGSFDLRADRKWFSSWRARESRDELRDTYGLTADAPRTIPDNVVMYLSVLAQFRGSDRGMKWGFTPQSPTLQNMTCRAQFNKVYELPGDHSSGVQSGKNSDGSAHAHATSRQARGMVTWEMFSHWLVHKGFARVTRVGEFTALEKYCLIANEDLGGVQIDGNQSGFSFLRASKFAGGFDATADSRFLKGRGHLVPSSQVADGRGYFVNERHWDIYQACKAPLRIEARNGERGLLSQCPNIKRWLEHRVGFSHVSWPDIVTLMNW
jgi:hypothetical protein